MIKARIYCPDKNPMQSGKAKMHEWILKFAPEKPYFVENLMGWTGMTDMPQEVVLYFPTKEAAIAYAERERIAYDVYLPKKRHLVRKTYADNFKFRQVSG